jgi:choline kinase
MVTTSRNIVAQVNKPKNTKYSVIIPAAGMGSRMKSYGPKCLLTVGETSILENQLRHINKCLPRSEIILVTGFEKTRVERRVSDRRNVKTVNNEDFSYTNVVRSIGLGLEQAKYDDVIIIYGDLVFNAYTLKAPFGSHSMILTDGAGYMRDSEVGCVVENHMLENMQYELSEKWAQISYFKGKELELLRRVCSNPKYYVYFGFEAINIILNSGGAFSVYQPKRMKIMDVGSSKDLDQARNTLI